MESVDKTLKKILNEGFKHGDRQKISSQLNALGMYLDRSQNKLEKEKILLLKQLLK